jgi:catalase
MEQHLVKIKSIKHASGKPFTVFENSMTVGPRGPILLQNYFLHEDMAHFNRERIPERVVHAKGLGVTLNEKSMDHSK